jgi:hypothetical protein
MVSQLTGLLISLGVMKLFLLARSDCLTAGVVDSGPLVLSSIGGSLTCSGDVRCNRIPPLSLYQLPNSVVEFLIFSLNITVQSGKMRPDENLLFPGPNVRLILLGCTFMSQHQIGSATSEPWRR